MTVAAPVMLGGAISTELQRRGWQVAAPWWSSGVLRTADGRGLLREVHKDLVAAGAQVITANTFRTNKHVLADDGRDDEDLIKAALDAARNGRDDASRAGLGPTRPARIAASIGPVRDSYSPALVPDDEVLAAEHRWHVDRLVEQGPDLLLAETMNTSREALAVLRAGKRLDQVVWVSFVCADGGRLLSGEPVTDAAEVAIAEGADAILVNCTSLPRTRQALAAIREAHIPGAVGCYPNIEDREGIAEWRHVNRYVRPGHDPSDFASGIQALADALEVSITGGCCGTTPEHIAAASALLAELSRDRRPCPRR